MKMNPSRKGFVLPAFLSLILISLPAVQAENRPPIPEEVLNGDVRELYNFLSKQLPSKRPVESNPVEIPGEKSRTQTLPMASEENATMENLGNWLKALPGEEQKQAVRELARVMGRLLGR